MANSKKKNEQVVLQLVYIKNSVQRHGRSPVLICVKEYHFNYVRSNKVLQFTFTPILAWCICIKA